MADIKQVLAKVDGLITLSRLHELAVIANSDRADRLKRIGAVLGNLPPGAYLLGTGPSTVGIIRLSVDEVVLGRAATPLEGPGEGVVDYEVADTLYFAPREVSRTHAKVVRGPDGQFRVVDLGSTRGTFVNGEPVAPEGDGWALAHGDVLSLGPSQVSTYVFYEATA